MFFTLCIFYSCSEADFPGPKGSPSQFCQWASNGQVDMFFSWGEEREPHSFLTLASVLWCATACPSQGLGTTGQPPSIGWAWPPLFPSSSVTAPLTDFILLTMCSCPLSCFLCHWCLYLKLFFFFIIILMPSLEGEEINLLFNSLV